MNRAMRLGGVLLCAASLSACATVTRGTRQNYTIETDPAGAQIALSTGQTCTSPCRLRLPRKHDFTVTARMEGYETATASVDSRIRAGGVAGAAGNILVGGIIGGIVDGSNGSMRDLMPNPLRISMARLGTAAEAAEEPAEGAAPAEDSAPADAAVPADAPAAAEAVAATPAEQGAPQGE